MGKYDALNPQQYQAVCHYEGPLLILAGAGSGKTRVLTHRVAWLIEEKNVNPWNIMAITFTNKAAGEMRDRVEAMLGGALGGVWVATFHSTCVRILRRYIDRIGFENNFTIYDSEDQKSVIKEICKRLQIDTKLYRERFFMAEISAAKDEMLSPTDYALKAQGDQRTQKVAEVYKEYQRQLFDNNALDFDDLICRTVELFQSCPEVLDQYQERFKFIMVDEYQDTNTAQFKLVSLLAAKYRNLCVVGDDDQSIYKFRGANIGNILNFEQFFPDAEVIRLEQNYRSTQNILYAANAVISHNKGRKEKTLWTDNGDGEKIRFRQFMNSFEEAEYVAGMISQKVGAGKWKYGDCAILYRTNAQSRMFEEKFLYANVPYKIVGGVNFYSRKEIKDVIAYLKTIANGKDDLAVRRIINVPKRGIGATTISRVQDYASEHGASFYDALRVAETIPGIGKSVGKLQAFVQMIQVLRTKQEFYKVKMLIEDILEQTGYMKELQAEGTDEALDRMANVDELLNKAAVYDEKTENPTLDGFLEEVALVADIDNLEEDADHVVMMTLHSAKGLEFPVVFMVGMEDGVFPSYISISSEDESELEEERRLCYVGITRARTNLFLTSAKQRMVRGEIHYNRVSRFVDDIPEEFMAENERAKIPQKEKKELPETKAHAAYRQMRENFKTKIMAQQQFEVKKSDGLSYNVGDRVRHIKFGNGTVMNIAEGGRDYEVTVNFDRVGVKKMFASFAKLVKTEN
ncbi:MAG: DNA helicase PcrA [Lachnospiraceae bacterium]|nr:DNA helicase PcrA [Lachnospiraceae bacterium]